MDPDLPLLLEPRGDRLHIAVSLHHDGKHAIAHNKVMIIDRECVITGSFNFTKAEEEKNAENILVIRGDPDLTSKYIGNFDWHLRHSEAYQGRDG